MLWFRRLARHCIRPSAARIR